MIKKFDIFLEQMAWSLSIFAIPAAPSRLVCQKKGSWQTRASTIGASGLISSDGFSIYKVFMFFYYSQKNYSIHDKYHNLKIEIVRHLNIILKPYKDETYSSRINHYVNAFD